MAITPTEWIWQNGNLVPWAEATEHVLAHALHYGTAVFEGIRAYATPRGPAIFRLSDHIRRLFDSARIYHIEIPYTADELAAACRAVIAENHLQHAYIRPLVYCGYGELSLVRSEATPVRVIVAAFPFGNLHADLGGRQGIDVCVSSWQRTTSASLPILAKAAGHYLNSQLITHEARRNGYAEGLALVDGCISEGAGENVFLIRDGVLYTPPLAASILGGITRDTVLQLAETLGIPCRQEPLPREFVYIAEEVFMTGTAAEITPVRSIDRLAIGRECPGPWTARFQEAFFGLFAGSTRDRWQWLDYVAEPAAR